MKKIICLAIATAALALTGCQSKREQEQNKDQSQAKIDSLERVIQQSNNETGDMARTIQQIKDGFRQINDAEGRITKQQEGESDEAVILENMRFIQRQMRLNRELIANLREQLRNANQTAKGTKSAYEAMIDEFDNQFIAKNEEIRSLQKQLAERDSTIGRQIEQIDMLNDNVADLTDKNAEKERKVNEQDQQLHAAWYVYGTKKELREQNILEKGDVMRSSDINHNYFTKIDRRVVKSIPLYSKSAELLTDHPAGSYSLDKDAQGQYTLRITNADSFWSVSRYLVVLVK